MKLYFKVFSGVFPFSRFCFFLTARSEIESKFQFLPREEDLATDDQIAAYKRNCRKISELKQGQCV